MMDHHIDGGSVKFYDPQVCLPAEKPSTPGGGGSTPPSLKRARDQVTSLFSSSHLLFPILCTILVDKNTNNLPEAHAEADHLC